MIVPVTAVFAAILGLLLLVLSLQVVRFRFKYRLGMGSNDDPAFEAAIRAHGNFVEYAPLALIMLGLAELNGVASGLIYWTGMALVLGRMLRQELSESTRTRLGYLSAKPAFDALRRRTDYREYGAAPLLGIDGGCFIGHGRSNAKAMHSSLRRAAEFVTADLAVKIRDKVAELHSEEDRLLGPVEAVR